MGDGEHLTFALLCYLKPASEVKLRFGIPKQELPKDVSDDGKVMNKK
jgi:hypothetical protein